MSNQQLLGSFHMAELDPASTPVSRCGAAMPSLRRLQMVLCSTAAAALLLCRWLVQVRGASFGRCGDAGPAFTVDMCQARIPHALATASTNTPAGPCDEKQVSSCLRSTCVNHKCTRRTHLPYWNAPSLSSHPQPTHSPRPFCLHPRPAACRSSLRAAARPWEGHSWWEVACGSTGLAPPPMCSQISWGPGGKLGFLHTMKSQESTWCAPRPCTASNGAVHPCLSQCEKQPCTMSTHQQVP